jgi:putative phage-type endonuclease
VKKSPEWHEARRKGIGGSDANTIMAGDPERIYRLWQEKLGQIEPEDLSWVLPVQMGSVTENLNAAFYSHTTGREITARNSPCGSMSHPYMRCELDGSTVTLDGKPAIWEAKHVNAFSNIEEVAQRYMAQLHHNMFCSEVRYSVLSVFIGTQKHEILEVALDEGYMMTLLEAEKRFWEAVEGKFPPSGFVPQTAPVPFDALREVSMVGHNEWAMSAADWLLHRDSAKAYEKAAKTLKNLVPADVGKAHGHGVLIKRSKSGSLTISETK